MAESTPQLPGVAARMAELVGLTATAEIAKKYGGAGVYIPKNLREDRALAKLIGPDALQLLMQEWAGEWLPMPKCQEQLLLTRDTQIRAEYKAGGTSSLKLATKYGLTERRIRQILFETFVSDDRQQLLFK